MRPLDKALPSWDPYTAMETHCPACGALIYSRRARLCDGCRAPIPEELRITGEQAQKIDALMKGMQENIKRMEQEEREDAIRNARRGGFM